MPARPLSAPRAVPAPPVPVAFPRLFGGGDPAPAGPVCCAASESLTWRPGSRSQPPQQLPWLLGGASGRGGLRGLGLRGLVLRGSSRTESVFTSLLFPCEQLLYIQGAAPQAPGPLAGAEPFRPVTRTACSAPQPSSAGYSPSCSSMATSLGGDFTPRLLLHSTVGTKPSCRPSSRLLRAHSTAPSLPASAPFLPTASLLPKPLERTRPRVLHKCLLSQYAGGRGTVRVPATCSCSHRLHPIEKL